MASADLTLHGGPKCRYNLHCWAYNIVVTMGGGIADEDNHDNHDKHGNDDHNDLDESQMIEKHNEFLSH